MIRMKELVFNYNSKALIVLPRKLPGVESFGCCFSEKQKRSNGFWIWTYLNSRAKVSSRAARMISSKLGMQTRNKCFM